MPSPTPSPSCRSVLLLGSGPLPSSDSFGAPGVANRLWHFAQPLIAARHDCLLITYERAGADPARARLEHAQTYQLGGNAWRLLPLAIEREQLADGLFNLAQNFGPQRIVSAGSLLPASHAVLIAERLGVPCWCDLFGDPLAELDAKAEVLGQRFNSNEQVMAWQMLLRVLPRSAAFSTVSRRQIDALTGQLLLAARKSLSSIAASAIHCLPCCVEELFPSEPKISRAELLSRHGIPHDALIALWSGGFNAWADPVTLVRGLELAMDRDPQLWFVATGGGLTGFLEDVFEQFKSLAAASRHAKRIVLLGWLPLAEAEQWLAVAELGIVVDRPCAETRLGARNRLLVHAAARHAILATEGCEVVADMAAAGALIQVPSQSPEELAAALNALAADAEQRRRLGAAAFDYCAENYTFAATAAPLLNWINTDVPMPQPGEAAEYIKHCLDPDARGHELRELQRLRESPLHRWLAPLRALRRSGK